MAFAQTKEAIGAVSLLLSTQLAGRTSATTVDIGRPEQAVNSPNSRKFNLFLYQVEFDPQLKNYSLDERQPVPLWLVLHYLLTAFDSSKETDSEDAHRLLGEGLLALHELNFISPDSTILELADNPEPLKITFDHTDAELISKIMQSSEEKYRLSASIQVRPVMIASSEPPAYAPAIKTIGPPGKEGVVVVPTMGPVLKKLSPEKFIPGQELVLNGSNITREFDQACIGDQSYPVTYVNGTTVKVPIPAGATLSSGNYLVILKRLLPSGREFSSNALLGHLLPVLNTATPSGLSNVGGKVTGTLDLTGIRLGDVNDSIFVAFYRDGKVAQMLEAIGSALQTAITITVTKPLEQGLYRIIVRVNGEQAQNSPEVSWI